MTFVLNYGKEEVIHLILGLGHVVNQLGKCCEKGGEGEDRDRKF